MGVHDVHAHGVIVDGRRHLRHEGVEGEGGEGVRHSVVHQELPIWLIEARDLYRHFGLPEDLPAYNGLETRRRDVVEVGGNGLGDGLEGLRGDVLAALEDLENFTFGVMQPILSSFTRTFSKVSDAMVVCIYLALDKNI